MDAGRLPVAAADFDRLTLASPDSSIVWLRYMTHHLETAEVDKARAVAERALKTISFRRAGVAGCGGRVFFFNFCIIFLFVCLLSFRQKSEVT